ncbi:HAD family hydrolase [Roseobacter sp.]|uniref:HAD family hydrolase n=1 Tax=Roseobacter sp. TaxID=1907202 RepID=UPI0032973E35
MSKIKGVLFDKDGTLFDFSSTWETWAASFLNRITETPAQAAALGAHIGFDHARQRFAPNSIVIAGTPDDIATALLPDLPDHSRDSLCDLLNTEAQQAPQAEVLPLGPYLRDLRARGLALGVATNDAEAPARVHLNRAGVVDLFDFIAGFDSGYGGKPAPGQLLGFAKAVDLEPQQVVMVGDSTHDLFAGRTAGMRRVGVLTGLATRDDLAPYADVVLDDISQLPEWIDAQVT